MKDNIKKISYIVTAFVVAGVTLFNAFTVPVKAATEITSLPRVDVDVEVTYDYDYVYLNYNDVHYRLLRSQPIKRVYEGSSTKKFLINYNASGNHSYGLSNSYSQCVPEYTDKESDGLLAPLSMWFSASENRVYMITGTNISTSGNHGMVKSYYGSSFIFDKNNSFVALNYYDLSDSSFHVLGLISLKGGSGSLCEVYPDMYVGGTGGINSYIDETGTSCLFPNDLICIYSSYEISGFYEFSGESVYTPKYYFDYQYVFYVEDVGYTFIDSARALVDIVDNNDSYAYLDFSEICNRRVWTSPDGITWSYSNLASAMYGDLLQMPYKWFFDNVGGSMIAKLIYTTDEDYEQEPIVNPEYGDIHDVVDNLNNIFEKYEPADSDRGHSYTFEELCNMSDADYYEFITYGFTHKYYKKIIIHYGDGTVEHVFDVNGNRWGSYPTGYKDFSYCEVVNVPTIAYYLYDFNMTLDDTNTILDSIRVMLHDDLKSVFDNITLTNYYLESIDSSLGSLPNYSKKLDSILLALENLEVKVPSSGNTAVFVDFSELQEYLVAIDDTTEIQILLEELDNSIDNIAKIEVFDEITDSSDIAGDVVDNVFDEVFDFEKAPELSKGADEVSGMISGAIGQLATGSILIGAFDYASNITSGVGFINANVNNFYEASSVMKPVFLSGAAMFVVNLVLRRKE